MINEKNNPVEWVLLLDELEEAGEHLEELIKTMCADGTIDDSEYGVRLAHVFAHLNRAWHTRDLEQELSADQWADHSKFPSDLEPAG